MRSSRLVAGFIVAGLAFGAPSGAVVLPTGFTQGFSHIDLTTQIDEPTAIAFAPDGRMFIAERSSGQVKIAAANGDVQNAPFVTLAGLATAGEQGLLGLALDPDFATPGQSYVYLYYTRETPLENRVVRYLEAGGAASGGEEAVLGGIPAGDYHNGGAVAFGPDETLFIQTGDTVLSGGANYGLLAQDMTSLAGKILRVSRDGSVPADNPFAGSANANTRRIFSSGRRNGIGVAPDFLHPGPLRVYVSENGWDTQDELDLCDAGENGGWPTVEGTDGATPGDGFADPLYVWSPIAAPTGVVQYRGSVYPERYRGGLFVGNNNGIAGEQFPVVIQFLDLNEAGDAVQSVEPVALFTNTAIVPMAESPDGLIYWGIYRPGGGSIFPLDFPLGRLVHGAGATMQDVIFALFEQAGLIS